MEGGVHFFSEAPKHHFSDSVQSFIHHEIHKPNKVWARQVIESERETENVKLRTDDFVLLPDLMTNRRQYKYCENRVGYPFYQFKRRPVDADASLSQKAVARIYRPETCDAPSGCEGVGTHKSLNWLAIVADPSIRTIRDLRGEHLPMLQELQDRCLEVIASETKIERHNVMVFANYPPSVYKLHFHFCAPFFKSSAYDGFRMHPLSQIINNLKVCPDYYRVSTIDVPLHVNSELYRVVQAIKKEEELQG